MRNLMIPVLLFFVSCASPRQGLDPARLPAQSEAELDREIKGDFDEDDIEDTVRLLPAKKGSDYHLLEISLGNSEKFTNETLVYAFSSPGASLELLETGSFKVIIDHSASGRSASLREYTISFHRMKFIVSGVTVSEFDRLDPELGGSCDINLLTGVGERNSRPVKLRPVYLELGHSKFEWLPKECRF